MNVDSRTLMTPAAVHWTVEREFEDAQRHAWQSRVVVGKGREGDLQIPGRRRTKLLAEARSYFRQDRKDWYASFHHAHSVEPFSCVVKELPLTVAALLALAPLGAADRVQHRLVGIEWRALPPLLFLA